jgi:hypothetical protein
MQSISGLGPFVGGEQKHLLAPSARCHDHPLAQAKLHLARLEVGNTDHEPPHEIFGKIGGLDTSKDSGSTGAR